VRGLEWPQRRDLPQRRAVHHPRLRRPWPDAHRGSQDRPRAGLASRHDPQVAQSATTDRPRRRTNRLAENSAALRAATELHCRISPYLDQGGALRAPRAGVSAAAQPWEACAAHADPTAQPPLINEAHRHLRGAAATVSLAFRLSSSQPPRLGRSLRSRRMRSAAPTLDPVPTRQDHGACESDGAE